MLIKNGKKLNLTLRPEQIHKTKKAIAKISAPIVELEVGASEIFFTFISQNYALLILLLVFSFLFASFSRLKIFHYNRGAKTVVAFVIAVGTAGIIHQVHWDQMTKVMAGLIAAGIVSMVIWSVALQRGKLRHETERDQEMRDRREMEERWRRENR